VQDLRVSPATGIGHRLIKCLILKIVIILSSVNHLCEKINNESGVFNLHFVVPFLRVVVSVFRLFSVLFQINGFVVPVVSKHLTKMKSSKTLHVADRNNRPTYRPSFISTTFLFILL
jgi:hypothetical protein